MKRICKGLGFVAALGAYGPALALDHSIEVDTDVQEFGTQGLELHLNVGRSRAPDSRRHPVAGQVEYVYGFARNWELGLALPASRINDDFDANGAKAKVQYVTGGDRGLYWGFFTELAYATNMPGESRWAAELSPIFGTRMGSWNFAVNPKLRRPLSGPDRDVEFEPAALALYSLDERNNVGVEYYAKLGPIKNFSSREEQEHAAFAVWHYEGSAFGVNFGVGRGLTDATERWIVKTIFKVPLK